MMDHAPEIVCQRDDSFVVFEIRNHILRIFQTEDQGEAMLAKGSWADQRYDMWPGRVQILPSPGEVAGRTFTARKRRGENQAAEMA